MCEITNGKIYVADRDLVCYKVMFEKEGQLKSLYQSYGYEIGQEYCINGFKYRCLTDDIVYEAWYKRLSTSAGWQKFHTTYSDLLSDTINTDLRYTHRGFYSYTYYGNGSMEWDIESMKRMILLVYGPYSVKCVRCRIPEGSKYMVSDNGEVFISERIVIDDAWSS